MDFPELLCDIPDVFSAPALAPIELSHYSCKLIGLLRDTRLIRMRREAWVRQLESKERTTEVNKNLANARCSVGRMKRKEREIQMELNCLNPRTDYTQEDLNMLEMFIRSGFHSPAMLGLLERIREVMYTNMCMAQFEGDDWHEEVECEGVAHNSSISSS